VKNGRNGLCQPLTLNEIKGHVSAAVSTELKTKYRKQQPIFFRAVTESHEKNWEHLQPGDLGLFCQERNYWAVARIGYRPPVSLPNLDNYIFTANQNPSRDRFVLFCLFDCVCNIDVSDRDIHRAAGDKPKSILRGFRVISHEESVARILEVLRAQKAKAAAR